MKIREIDINIVSDFWIILSYTKPNGDIFSQKYGGFREKECIKKFKKSYRQDTKK